jgi:hypothetical protein
MKVLFTVEENKIKCLETLTCAIPKEFIKIIYLPIKVCCRLYEHIYIYINTSKHDSKSKSMTLRK